MQAQLLLRNGEIVPLEFSSKRLYHDAVNSLAHAKGSALVLKLDTRGNSYLTHRDNVLALYGLEAEDFSNELAIKLNYASRTLVLFFTSAVMRTSALSDIADAIADNKVCVIVRLTPATQGFFSLETLTGVMTMTNTENDSQPAHSSSTGEAPESAGRQ